MANNSERSPYLAYQIIQKMYYPKDFDNVDNEENILNKYATSDQIVFGEGNDTSSPYTYIEIPDRLTNINGSHIYKLISSKDIDWDNALLKYSAVPFKNWGDFDEKRRWSSTEEGQQITINDVYELMNVIDYLLCSCENLWDEINKLKYNTELEKLLYYVFNAKNASLLGYDDNKITKTNPITQITYLNPFTDYSQLNSDLEDFGMATEISDTSAQYNIYILKEYNNQVIPGITRHEELSFKNTPMTTIQYKGTEKEIFGNPLYDEIRLYPSANIYNFINKYKYSIDEVIDITNKKFKYENIYCIDLGTTGSLFPQNTYFRKVYIDFYKDDNNYNNYMIYFIENDVKYIIYYSSNDLPANNTQNINTLDFTDISSWYLVDDNPNLTTLQKNSILNTTTVPKISPFLYIISDKFTSTFRISTQGQISGIPTMSEDINFDYYKNTNTLEASIFIKDESQEEIEVKKMIDINEQNNLLYNNTLERYNLPANSNIIIKTNSTYSSTTNNIIKDRVYEDIMLYKNENTYEDQFHNSITSQDNLYSISEDLNEKTVIFNQKSINNYNSFYKIKDVWNKEFAIIYKKIENPYQLSYSLYTNSYLNNIETNFATCQNIIQNIENSIHYDQENQNNLIFTYDLDNLEQIKFDLKLFIDETPKVKGISKVLPINLNKIYNPTINFICNEIVQEEFNSWNNNNISKINYYKSIQGQQETILLSTILNDEFRYQIENNLKYASQYNDIVQLLYPENTNSSGSSDEITYNMNYNINNADNYSYFITYYDNSYSYISLIGAEYTRNVLTNNKYLTYFTYINDSNQIQSYYMFNINNLSENYRLKGGDNYWQPLVQVNHIQLTKHLLSMYNKFFNYNSYAVSVKNNLNNLTTYMNININNINADSQTTVLSEENNIISTNAFDIIKDQYKLVSFKEENNWQPNSDTINDQNIVNNYPEKFLITYVPIISMELQQSTFKVLNVPPYNSTYFQINTNYNKFIQEWDSSKIENNIYVNNALDHYYTTNIQLQLLANKSNDLPFFNPSNTAQCNFKILRKSPNTEDVKTSNLKIDNLFKTTEESHTNNKILLIDLNKKYYLSDLYNIEINKNDVIIGCLPYNQNNNTYFEEFTHHISNKYQVFNDKYYMIPYLDESNINYQSLNKINKFIFPGNNRLFDIVFPQGNPNPNLTNPLVDVIYNSYFNIHINNISNDNSNLDNIVIVNNLHNDTETSIKNLFMISDNPLNTNGCSVNMIYPLGFMSNFKYLNYLGGGEAGSANIPIVFLTRKSTSYMIGDYEQKQIIFTNNGTQETISFEIFTYIDITSGQSNYYNYYTIKRKQGQPNTIEYKILNEDNDYQGLNNSFEKYKYQVNLFMNSFDNSNEDKEILCNYYYFTNNIQDSTITLEDITNRQS